MIVIAEFTKVDVIGDMLNLDVQYSWGHLGHVMGSHAGGKLKTESLMIPNRENSVMALKKTIRNETQKLSHKLHESNFIKIGDKISSQDTEE